MIKALYQIGKIYEAESKKSELEELVDNPNVSGKYSSVLILHFSYHNDIIEYNTIDLQEFSNDRLVKYLYSKGTSRGGDNTPTTIISKPADPLAKLLLPINKIKIPAFVKLSSFLNEKHNYDIVSSEIKKQLEPKRGYVLTLTINSKWPGDYDELIEVVRQRKVEKYYKLESMGVSKSRDAICYVCNQPKSEVFGFANTYNFYTVDKKGFVIGGFDRTKSWKNYPVCPDCTSLLEKGKKYLAHNFYGKFAGFTYMVIPHMVLPVRNENDFLTFKLLVEDLAKQNKITLSKGAKKQLFSNEELAFEAMKEIKNIINYTILFYKEDQNAFRILANIEDVFPSRLKQLFDYKHEVEESPFFKDLPKGKDDFFSIPFNFQQIRHFFPNKKIEGDWDKSCLEIIHNIFVNKKIDYNFMISNYLRIIRPKFAREESVFFDTRVSFLITKFLFKARLLKNIGIGSNKAMIERNDKNSIYLDCIEEHQEVLNSDVKRGIFLEGVLVKKLLNIQFKDRKAMPFYSRLNGLKLNEKIVKRLLPETMNKLYEYNKNYYFALENLISKYLLHASFTDMSNDEISYLFALGMNLANNFKHKEESHDDAMEVTQ